MFSPFPKASGHPQVGGINNLLRQTTMLTESLENVLSIITKPAARW